MTERLAVRASYTVTKDGAETSGRVEFVARIVDASRGYKLEERARRAVARRLGIRLADVRITGVMGS